MKQNKSIDLNTVLENPLLRKELAKQSHYWFFNLYLSEYVKFPTAPFQKEIFAITENDQIKRAVIIAFRGSAKSTIMTLSFPIWAIIGRLQAKHVMIFSQTQHQAKAILSNIKAELEINDMLRNELGPFQEDDQWASTSLVIPKYNARITAMSSEQSVRGMRHRSSRPDIVIVDDPEDTNSTRTLEGRDRAERWLSREVMPLGEPWTRYFFIGNLLHRDSLMMRLKKTIRPDRKDEIYKEYPLMNDDKVILWPGKYKNLEDIENERHKLGPESSWQQEYLLRIVDDKSQVVKEDMIHYYSELPQENELYTAAGVDLAVKQNEHSDETAVVQGKVYFQNGKLYVYILPNPIHVKIPFPEIIEMLKAISRGIDGSKVSLFIEETAAQSYVIQQLNDSNYQAEPASPGCSDKRMRLSLITHSIQNGQILFPEQGAEDLIAQLINFGSMRHDDLVDAFVYLVNAAFADRNQPFNCEKDFCIG